MDVISVQNLSKSFSLGAGFFSRTDKNVYAVNDVSFKLESGTSYGIVGESGCGKTTCARLLVRMYNASSGKIFYTDENNLSKEVGLFSKKELKSYREKVKYIFQDPAKSLNPRLTVYEIITSSLKHSSEWKGKEDAYERAKKIILEVGLSESDLQRRPQEFSGGQRQRISLARALIMNPRILICDEVVSALDVSIQAQILNLLNDLKKTRDISFIFITHDLRVACYFCDTIAVMYRGTIVEEGPAQNLFETAYHPYTKLLFKGALGEASATISEVKTSLEKEDACVFAHRCPHVNEQCTNKMPDFKQIASDHKARCII